MNQPPNNQQVVQRAFLHLVVRRRLTSTAVTVSANSRRHSGPTTPMSTISVEHRPTQPLLVRVVSVRPVSRPIILDSFNQESYFRYAYVIRSNRQEIQHERIRRDQMPQVGFAVRQFTATLGSDMTGLDIIYSGSLPLRPQQPAAMGETEQATRRRNRVPADRQGGMPNRGSSSATEQGPSTPLSLPQAYVPRPSSPASSISSSNRSSGNSSRATTPEEYRQGDMEQPEQ